MVCKHRLHQTHAVFRFAGSGTRIAGGRQGGQGNCEADSDFASWRPTAIAVAPIENFSLEQGISLQRLGRELKADAILMGQIEQSSSIHSGLYDAVVVSTSLRLFDAKSVKVIWRTEQ